MKLLHAALAVVGATPPERPDRERLKAAIAQRELALKVLEEAREFFGRQEAVIKISDDASKVAADATRAATEARNAWVRNGCTFSGSRELQGLDEAAADASRTAKRAALDADAVSRELARSQDAIRSRQSDIGHCEIEISAAIGEIIAAENSALLHEYVAHMEEGRSKRVRIMAMYQELNPGRYEDAGAKSHEGARLVEAALIEGTIRPWDQERESAQAHDFVHGERGADEAMLDQLRSRVRARAAQLRENPDA